MTACSRVAVSPPTLDDSLRKPPGFLSGGSGGTTKIGAAQSTRALVVG
ncbi:MAG: hypothetical protein ACI9K5_002101 [Gammaproteobacteria bacterium]|jgi:hypothetical protein